MTAAQNGSSIFPLIFPTIPIVPEFAQDNYVQMLELIASQCAPASGASLNNATLTGTTTMAGANSSDNITFTAVGKGPVLKQGANGLVGTFTLNGATPVTVSNTAVAITDAIVISLNTVGGTVGVQPHIPTITGGSGFTVVGTASDTSVYNYALIKNAA